MLILSILRNCFYAQIEYKNIKNLKRGRIFSERAEHAGVWRRGRCGFWPLGACCMAVTIADVPSR